MDSQLEMFNLMRVNDNISSSKMQGVRILGKNPSTALKEAPR